MNEHQRKLLITIFLKHGTQPIGYGTLDAIREEVIGDFWVSGEYVGCDLGTLMRKKYLIRTPVDTHRGWSVSDVALAELKEFSNEKNT